MAAGVDVTSAIGRSWQRHGEASPEEAWGPAADGRREGDALARESGHPRVLLIG